MFLYHLDGLTPFAELCHPFGACWWGLRLVFRESGMNMIGAIVREPRFVNWLHDTVRGGLSWCLLAVLEHVAP
jgi:hypothetical protein